MEYLKKHARPASAEKGMDLFGKPMTTKADRPRASYGSLLMSTQTVRGLCSQGRKCVRKEGHEGGCYPA